MMVDFKTSKRSLSSTILEGISLLPDPNMKAAGVGRNWTQTQKDDLLAFLFTLSDIQFLTDTTFADPF
jgi:hypothetical protein